jgi:hypothetical protein
VPTLPVNEPSALEEPEGAGRRDVSPASLPELPRTVHLGTDGTPEPRSGDDPELDRAADLILRDDASGNRRAIARYYRQHGLITENKQRWITRNEVPWDMERERDCGD